MDSLTADRLYRFCDPSAFPYKTSAEAPLPEKFIGQDRAERSMEFGLAIERKGYNIFLVGPRGTGKSSIIESLVRKAASAKPTPDDWCLVYNFADPAKPKALRFPAGQAIRFKKRMENLLKSLKESIPRVLESREFEEQRSDISEKLQERQRELLSELDQLATKHGFTIKKTQTGFLTIPIIDNQPVKMEELPQLSEEQLEVIREKKESLDESIREAFRQIRKHERTARDKIQELEKVTVGFVVDRVMDDVREEYENFPGVPQYLQSVHDDLLENIDNFKLKPELPIPRMEFGDPQTSFSRYHVNVLVDNSHLGGGAPVIFELNPTYHNLFGKMERRAVLGALTTDFTMIEAGSFLRANGGYLILQAKDVLKSPFSWDGLKRAILNSQIQIEDLFQEYAVVPTAAIRPEPIPANVKIIMSGDPAVYGLLHTLDEDFLEMFKVKVHFDYEMDRTPDNESHYASFIRSVMDAEQLLTFDAAAMAAIIEYGSRLVENQDKLSTQFSAVSDLIRESDFWAKQASANQVGREHVDRALEQKLYRAELIAEKYQEWLDKGIIMVDTENWVVGQINGLAIYNLGDFLFGKPSRVTAATFLGRSGVVSIEREARLSGRTHDKGLLILSGYLSEKFASDKPLNLGATVCFEQSYEEIDGDSASSTELIAILSSLAETPIYQGIALTGSVNQKGELQPIGAVNYKIEGFFELCRKRGLNGKQGVIIPHQNVKNLMLKPQVLNAVSGGRFHIYAVKEITEVIEILTGTRASDVFEKADRKLQQFTQVMKERIQKK